MNNTKTPEQITEQIGKILGKKPRVFGMQLDDIRALTLKRATDIVSGLYLKNLGKYNRLHADYEDTMSLLQAEHSELLIANEALEYLVRHDSLTQLPNRKELDRRIKNDITTEDTEVVFMIFDLRKFKYINDSYGHEVGDNVLMFIAGVCKEVCKLYPDSLIARKGGDEFTGMFPGCTQDDMRGIADNFVQILHRHWENRPDELQIITDPVGVAMGLISLQDPYDVDIVIKQKGSHQSSSVDTKISKALYKADKMSEAAKNVSGGIVITWDDEYAKEVNLSDKNKELLNQLNGIIRHWISDESVDQNIRSIRDLLSSTLDGSHVIEELDRIRRHYDDPSINHNVPKEILNEIRAQMRLLHQMFTEFYK